MRKSGGRRGCFLLLALLLCSCWGHSLPGWDATPSAGFERVAAAHLTICVRGNLCQFTRQCIAISAARCVDAGYPASCGNGEPEGSCGEALR